MTIPSTSRPLAVWAVSDGRAGIENQALGLAEAVASARPADVVVKRITWKGAWGRLPWQLNPAPRLTLRPDSAIAPPWPDIWIAAGRATLPLSLRIRRWSKGKTFVVQLQDPGTPLGPYDLVIPPRHDGLTGDRVFSIVGAPNRITAERLAADLLAFAPVIEPLPRPRVAVLIGGKSRAYDLSPARAADIARRIDEAMTAAGGSLMMTFSRRTPDQARRILASRLNHLPGVIWDDQGPNPYFAYLAAADAILVTEDSANLATDAAATGAPVYVLGLDGGSPKFRLFHEDLQQMGISRPFQGDLETWTYPPLAETARAAAELLRRYDARSPA